MSKLQDDVLSEWRKKYADLQIISKLKSGKEADLWLVRVKGELCALKVYVAASLSIRAKYSEGQWISEASLRKAQDFRTPSVPASLKA